MLLISLTENMIVLLMLFELSQPSLNTDMQLSVQCDSMFIFYTVGCLLNVNSAVLKNINF